MKIIALTAGFLLELAAIGAFVVGFVRAIPGVGGWVLGVALALLAVAAWGAFVAPRARFAVSGGVRITIELAVFAGAGTALIAGGLVPVAVVLWAGYGLVYWALGATGGGRRPVTRRSP
jgi:hypothetical protein